MAGNVDLKYNCFLAKIRQEIVQLDATIRYLQTIRDELQAGLDAEEDPN